jgi:hypothetical protein
LLTKSGSFAVIAPPRDASCVAVAADIYPDAAGI